MEHLYIIMAGLTAVILFIFGLEHFSQEIERITGERFRKSLSRATRIPIIGVALGALVTAVIQSSSATSVITIGLVNAGVISFKNSVGIIFGANVGTTITAQLVAFKLTAFAPVFIILGFTLSLVRSRFSIFGKSIFYFGFVFFCLNLISTTLAPLQNEPAFTELLIQPQNPLLAILVGCLVTAVLQSSSVTTGLAIIFTQQGLLSLENAVPIMMGANIGTTATGLIAMFNMDIAAKKTALSHFFFNFGGVLIFTPLLFIFGSRLGELDMAPAIALANIHLVFNVGTTLIFLLFIKPFTRLVDVLLGEGEMDFRRVPVPVFDAEKTPQVLRRELQETLWDLFAFLQENYRLVSLSIETNYRSIFDAAAKRIDYVDYIHKEVLSYFSKIVPTVESNEESRQLMRMTGQFDYLFQIHDSINDLFMVKKVMRENYIELRSDILLHVREISSPSLAMFEDVQGVFQDNIDSDLTGSSAALQSSLDDTSRKLFALMQDSTRRDVGALINFVTYSRRMGDKLLNFSKLEQKGKERLKS